MDAFARLEDPRCYQILVLSLLLAYGLLALDFGIRWYDPPAILTAAQLTQYIAGRIVGLARFDPMSAIITSLSLTLLLRTGSTGLAALAAVIAIGSKFIVRLRGKHVFNPANLAIVSLTLCSDRAWISSGQWGSATIGALALACLGLLVLTRARRAETTLAFIGAYALLVLGRATWLGDPIAIPLHQLQSGALLIFAFFMISDPKTAPDSCVGRALFGSIVASVAYVVQFVFYTPSGPILALVMCAPLVPLIDFALTGRSYQWIRPATSPARLLKGVF